MGTKRPKTFEVGSWCGQPNYKCRLCPYETLDRSLILKHARAHGAAAAAQKRAATPANPDSSNQEV